MLVFFMTSPNCSYPKQVFLPISVVFPNWSIIILQILLNTQDVDINAADATDNNLGPGNPTLHIASLYANLPILDALLAATDLDPNICNARKWLSFGMKYSWKKPFLMCLSSLADTRGMDIHVHSTWTLVLLSLLSTLTHRTGAQLSNSIWMIPCRWSVCLTHRLRTGRCGYPWEIAESSRDRHKV